MPQCFPQKNDKVSLSFSESLNHSEENVVLQSLTGFFLFLVSVEKKQQQQKKRHETQNWDKTEHVNTPIIKQSHDNNNNNNSFEQIRLLGWATANLVW